jgi:hypothetical protein
MKKRSEKYKRHLLSRSESVKAVKNRKDYKNIVHIYKNSLPAYYDSNTLIFIDLKAPPIFKLQFEHVEPVLEYITQLKLIGEQGKGINILMNDIIEIGEGAIAMLLSVMEELVSKQVHIKGMKPNDEVANDILEKSGFFNYVNGKVSDKNRVTKNTILKTGYKNTHQKVLASAIRKAMETIWGVLGRNPLVYSSTVEMMRNSCDHAFKRESNIQWHLALTHDDIENSVKFSFVDNGKGIIKTFVEQRLLTKVLHLFKDNCDLLETAFKDGIESRTGLSWRGKGLPTIFENYSDSYIKNLVVISNDVYIDFDRNIKEKLSNPFKGTYYFWVVDRSCEKACFID